MAGRLSDILLSRLSKSVAAQMGLHFPRERWLDLERGIGSAAREFGFQDAESCIQWLVSSPLTKNQIEILASHLTVGETYFFREKKSFEILEDHILPELIRSRRGTERRLRIWTAGCSAGEEPYSIAILLSKMIADLKDWNMTILATDINPRFLQKASEGVYSEWSFRETPLWIKERYFKRTKEGRFEILPHLKKMVTFSSLNLAEDAYPSLLNNTNAMDIIFCRNVLMYFAPERVKNVIQHLYRSLVDGGWLIVSPSETSHVLYPQFVTVNFPGATLYRRPRMGGAESGEIRETGKWRNGEWEMSLPDFPVPSFSHPLTPPSPDPRSLIPDSPKSGIVKERKATEPQRTLYAEALALYEQGCYAEVAEKLLELFSHNQGTPEAMALLARAYANQGKLAEALKWCEKAIAADELNSGLHYLRATILQEQNALDEAVLSLKRALYLDPNFVLAHFALGNLTLQQGKWKESGKHFENVLSLLSAYWQEDILPESEGMTAGRLVEIIRSTNSGQRSASPPPSPPPLRGRAREGGDDG